MSPLPDEAIASCVARVAIFRGLDAPQREDIARFGHRVELDSGGRLYGVGDHVSDLFVVHSGRVRMVRILAPGKEQLIRMAGPGETSASIPSSPAARRSPGSSPSSRRSCASSLIKRSHPW